MAKLSICLPVYNGAGHVEDALASIAAQTSSDYVVLASDNASTDGTAKILERWADRIPLELVTQPHTVPMQAHFDLLLDRVATESYMLLCHDDYFYSPAAIETALTIFDQQPAISAIYCDLAYVSEKGRPLAFRRFGRAGEMVGNIVGRQSLRSARNMFGIPLLVRTAALGTNRYDPQFRYALDLDLSWTISKHAPAWHIPEVMIANRYRGSNSTWDLMASADGEFVRLAHKHGVHLTTLARARLKWTNWQIGQQRRLFGLYERLVTKVGGSAAS